MIAIVGSGGGLSDIHWFGAFPPSPPIAQIEPSRATVQVGATVVFTVSTTGGTTPFSYQWRRNGLDIAGATGTIYTLAGANLGDDGVEFAVAVTSSSGVGIAASLLRVSSMPGVVIEDGDFLPSDWTVTAIADPPQNGPTYSESPSATGGYPDAYLSTKYRMPLVPSSIRVFHTAVSTYDPKVLGAIYTIDFAHDCRVLAIRNSPFAKPMLEQGGRKFAPPQPFGWDCPSTQWQTVRISSLRADEFALTQGPACGANEACPDFSASAAPLRSGFVGGVDLPVQAAAGSTTQGIDNWTLTVWRR